MTIYSGFSHWKWWFSIVMLVYQRVPPFYYHKWAATSKTISALPPMRSKLLGLCVESAVLSPEFAGFFLLQKDVENPWGKAMGNPRKMIYRCRKLGLSAYALWTMGTIWEKMCFRNWGFSFSYCRNTCINTNIMSMYVYIYNWNTHTHIHTHIYIYTLVN